jgi:penicillin-binding protein activator
MRRLLSVVFIGSALGLSAGCASKNRQVSRVGADTQTDLSGNWNDTDARLTSEALIGQAFGAAWLSDFQTEQGRKPVVRVREVVNKSDEHIDVQVFIKNIERAMVNSGKVKIVAQTGSELNSVNAEQDYGASGRVSDESAPSLGNQTGGDFVLVGRVGSILDQAEGEKAKFYKITFELISATSGEKVWIGDHEIKKLVSQAKASW